MIKNSTLFLLLNALLSFSAVAQIGVADPQTGNASINFFGQVVDQDGRPISGAKVNLSVFMAYLSSSNQLATRHDKSILETDANGNFALTGASGHSVTVESVEKEGFKLSERTPRQYSYSWSSDIFHPDSSAPVVFRMWKRIGMEGLVGATWHGKVADDGTTNRFDLLRGTADAGGNLEIVCMRTPLVLPPASSKRFEYELQISIVGGGIQVVRDEFGYLAPRSNYSPSVVFGEKADDPQWKGKLPQEFYIKTADGHYGTLTVEWGNGFRQPPLPLKWACSINPTGSRNLER